MNHDLQNKIDEAEASLASQMEYINGMKDDRALSNYPSLPVHSYLWAFSEGAKFGRNDKQIQSLKDEIDRLKICDAHATIFQMENTHLHTKLAEAKDENTAIKELLHHAKDFDKTIVTLRDENKKFREALEWYADRNNWEFESYKNDCKDRVKFSDLGVKSFNGENNFADYACSSGGRRARQALEGVSK